MLSFEIQSEIKFLIWFDLTVLLATWLPQLSRIIIHPRSRRTLGTLEFFQDIRETSKLQPRPTLSIWHWQFAWIICRFLYQQNCQNSQWSWHVFSNSELTALKHPVVLKSSPVWPVSFLVNSGWLMSKWSLIMLTTCSQSPVHLILFHRLCFNGVSID